MDVRSDIYRGPPIVVRLALCFLLAALFVCNCTNPPECSPSQVCPTGQICLEGKCGCPTLQERCGQECIRLYADLRHCGACGQSCSAGQVCINASCQAAPTDCPEGLKLCDQRCTDTDFHPFHCGDCGAKCEPAKVCWGRQCTCPLGAQVCDGTCLDVLIHPKHCGRCNNACQSGLFCYEGRCVQSCPATTSACVGGCVDFTSHPSHCGACQKACPGGQICASGQCQCPPGTASCDGRCVDLNTTRGHCGKCGQVCQSGQVCAQGRCVATCPASTPTVCLGGCHDTMVTQQHCGACSNACALGQVCVSGQCKCPDGKAICSEQCVDLQSSPNHCGNCEKSCAPDEQCISGECQLPPPGEGLSEPHDESIHNEPQPDAQEATPESSADSLPPDQPIPAAVWATRAGSNSSDDNRDMVLDAQGNILITGSFSDTADFGSTNLVSLGRTDVYVAKLDATGKWLWARGAGSSGMDNGLAVATDKQGNVYISGGFVGQASFGATTLTSKGDRDIYVAKLDAAGVWLWARRAGSSAFDESRGIAIDSQGNVVVTGVFSDTSDFGALPPLVSVGSADIFVAKLDSAGTWLWARRAGGSSNDVSNKVAVASQDNLYVTGSFQATADFGTQNVSSRGANDIFVAKLDAAGTWLWVKRAGSANGQSPDYGTALAVDQQSNVIVTGTFSDQAAFGASMNLNSTGGADVFVAKLDSAGSWLWAKRAGSTEEDIAYGVTVDQQGHSFVTGRFRAVARFGTTDLTSQGENDIFVAKLDDTGKWLWAFRAGAGQYDVGFAIKLNAQEELVVSGTFQASVSFGKALLTSKGLNNIFVWKPMPVP